MFCVRSVNAEEKTDGKRCHRFLSRVFEISGKQRDKIAVLPLTGKIEDYLVKEFACHAYDQSNGQVFALTNVSAEDDKGKKKRTDICLLGGNSEKPIVRGLIEAKHVRNKHKGGKGNTEDQNSNALKNLSKQLAFKPVKFHGEYQMKLASRSKCIYGLVFASYVTQTQNDKQAKPSLTE